MEQKDLFQSMLRKELMGPSPVPFVLAEFGGISSETTPDGRLISEDEWEEGLVFYRGERYRFRFPPRPEGRSPQADYAVVGVNSKREGLWSLVDHAELVFELLNMRRTPYVEFDVARMERNWGPTWEDRHPFLYGVDEREMRSFLQTYGPLTPSWVRLPGHRVTEAMIDEFQVHAGDDSRIDAFALKFSALVDSLHRVARKARRDPREGIVGCFGLIGSTPGRCLYRSLVGQFLGHLFAGNPVHVCEGCGRWFSFTEGETQARHREGWKRRDARYHSRACLKAASERRRRAKLRDRKADGDEAG